MNITVFERRFHYERGWRCLQKYRNKQKYTKYTEYFDCSLFSQ